MEKFLLSERYRLELHWRMAVYKEDGVCDLVGAYFSGPALKIAEKINDNDNINIDFCKQYYIVVKNIYVANLSWKESLYNKDGNVELKNAKIMHDALNNVPKLLDSDYVVIDTEKHESATHVFFTTYDAYIINCDNILYKF